MAKSKGVKSPGGGSNPEFISKESIRIGDIVTAAQGFSDSVSYEGGYPGIANSDLHINRGKGREKL